MKLLQILKRRVKWERDHEWWWIWKWKNVVAAYFKIQVVPLIMSLSMVALTSGNSGDYLQAFLPSVPDSTSGKSKWDLWWTKWQCVSIFLTVFRFSTVSHHSTNDLYSPLFIRHRRCIIRILTASLNKPQSSVYRPYKFLCFSFNHFVMLHILVQTLFSIS